MKHSGVAITITSVTDFLAFGIGTFSKLPAFSSFCFYAAIGTVAMFFNICSFFLGWLILDQKRIDDKRDAIFCCKKKTDEWTPNESSQTKFQGIFLQKYSTYLDKGLFKFVVIIVTTGLFIASCFGVKMMESKFDILKWLPDEEETKYVREYFDAESEYFPENTIYGQIYIADVPSVEKKLVKINEMVTDVKSSPDIPEIHIYSFLSYFLKSMEIKGKKLESLSLLEVRKGLRDFLCPTFEPDDGKEEAEFDIVFWRNSIHFIDDQQLKCDEMNVTPPIRMLKLTYSHERYHIIRRN